MPVFSDRNPRAVAQRSAQRRLVAGAACAAAGDHDRGLRIPERTVI
jgi:hypothetical protein